MAHQLPESRWQGKTSHYFGRFEVSESCERVNVGGRIDLAFKGVFRRVFGMILRQCAYIIRRSDSTVQENGDLNSSIRFRFEPFARSTMTSLLPSHYSCPNDP